MNAITIGAPVLWVIVPVLTGLILWFFRHHYRRTLLVVIGLCLLLAVLALAAPLGQQIRLPGFSITLTNELEFAGRSLVIQDGDRPLLVLIFLLCVFWFSGSRAAGANNLLVPFGMGIAGLLVAALAVEPFLYSALLIEMVVLLSVPILAPPGKVLGQGVLRFLIFQTLAMPFILLSGWALAGLENDPTSPVLISFATVFLGLGFAFWLAIFPFYTWIPLLSEQTYPYISGFLFLLLPTVQLLLCLNFLDRFGWLRSLPNIYTVIGQIGLLMVVTAGVWAAFQRDMARQLGYGVIIETGFSLLAVSLNSHTGSQMFASMFLPRIIGLGLWALSLSILLRESRSTRFEDMQGLAQKMPFASAGLVIASLALGGLPLLAVFPIHQALLEELAGQSLVSALWVLVGSIGMLFGAFRSLNVLAGRHLISLPRPGAGPQVYCESRMQIALVVTGISALLLIGIFPQVFLPLLNGLLSGYPQLP